MTALPTPTDLLTAHHQFTTWYEADPSVSRQWIALHRERAVRGLAVAAMQVREAREWRARFSGQRRAA